MKTPYYEDSDIFKPSTYDEFVKGRVIKAITTDSDYEAWGYERVGTSVPGRKGLLGPRGVLLRNTREILKRHNKRHALKNKTVGMLTQVQRYKIIHQIMNQLHDAGFRLIHPSSIDSKHAEYVIRLWEEEQLSASTLTNRYTVLKTFMSWMGVDNRLSPLKEYLIDPQRAVRINATTVDKTWNLDDLGSVLIALKKGHPLQYLYLSLMQSFGLRQQEAMMLNPYEEKNAHLQIIYGSKGGRRREVPIETDKQAELITVAQKVSVILDNKGRIMPKDLSIKAAQARFYRAMKKYGITRKNCMTAHGLRHEYANLLYMSVSDDLSPIKGGRYDKKNEKHKKAKQIVSKNLGHARIQITDAYIGG